MKLIYMDESGTGSIQHEPIIVVTGVMVDPDTEWRLIDEDLKNLVNNYIPPEDHAGFAFHATHLFHGNKYFDKERWPRELRWEILSKLVELFRVHQVPLAWGMADKRHYEPIFAKMSPPLDARSRLRVHQGAAFALCAAACELWLQTFTADETGLMIAEDNPDVRTSVRHFHTKMKNPAEELFKVEFLDLRPFSQVIDTVHFATKADTRLFQLADVAAFLFRRAMAGHQDVQQFLQPLVDAMRWQIPTIVKDPTLLGQIAKALRDEPA